jgi:PAS domain S-box-containing protein
VTTLRRKILVLVGGLVAGLGFVSLLLGTIVAVWQARDLEESTVRQNALRVQHLLESELEHLDRFVRDWAFWDDTYQFVVGDNPDYEASNLVPETFRNARVGFIIYANRMGETVYARACRQDEDALVPIGPSVLDVVRANGLLKGFETRDDYRRGFLMVDGQIFLVAARAILTSQQLGPPRGVLMMGRRVDEASWRAIADILLVEVHVGFEGASEASAGRLRRLAAAREEPAIEIDRQGWRAISGYLLLRDMLRKPMAVVEVSMPRQAYLATLRNVGLFWLILAAVCIAAVWGAAGGLNRIVLARTSQLHGFVTALRSKDTLSERVKVGGEDEIAALAESVNLLLDKLQNTMDDLRRTEADLQAQQAFLKQVVDAHPGYVWVKDEHERFLLVNRGLADFCQTTPEQMIGRLDSDFNPNPAEVERFHREDEEVRRTGQPMVVPEAGITALNGARIWISTYKVPLRDRDGRCTRVLAVAVDISELKRGQEALRQSEARYRRLYENAPVAIVLWDKEGRILGWNPHAEKTFGWQRHEVLWRDWIELLVPAADRAAMADAQRAVIEGHAPLMMVGAGMAKSGFLLYCEWHHAAIRDGQEFVAGLSFAVDVTDQKRVEEEKRQLEIQVQQAQKLESLGVLAGGIAHDFNNILMAILGNADLALAELPADAPVRTTVEEIILGARRASDLCRQLLAYSGHGRFVIEPLDLNRLVREMVRMLEVAISKKAILRIECTDPLPAIEADGTQIRQVVMNLVLNASEAIGQRSGIISIRTGIKDCSREFLNRTLLGPRLKPGLYVCLEVADTGCGMDRDTVARIFEPFFTTKFTGRGLGLAAVLGILRSHDGTIEVESELGKGSTFRAYFPVSEKTIEQAGADNAPVPWRGTGTVLVVDDEETVRALAARMLERCGFKVVVAGDGREAMEALSQHVQDITAVLLDLTMPHMDGREALEELRKINPNLPVVLSSGYSEHDLAARFGSFAKVAYLEKPYTRAGLITAFRKVLHT